MASKAEKSYIQAGLSATPSSRTDGRGLYHFRPIALETGVSSLANGSARLSIGRDAHDGGGGTEVLAAAKLEVENLEDEGVEGGRMICTVSCSPTAYASLSTSALDDLQADLSTLLHQTLSHHSLHPTNLGILKGKKAWLLNLDLLVLADAGNVLDALFMAAHAALWDTKVPRTRSVEYKAKKSVGGSASTGAGNMDVDVDTPSGFDTREIARAVDFELPDYWDEGEVLDGRERWPVAVTLNLVQPTHYLDATTQEESATPLRLLTAFSFPPSSPTPHVQAMRILGAGEVKLEDMQSLLQESEKHARQLSSALKLKLQEEDTRRNQKARERFSKR